MIMKTVTCGTLVLLLTSACAAGQAPTAPSTAPARPTTTAAAAETSLPAVASKLPGIGASRAAWDSAHAPAPGFDASAAYLPLVNGRQPKYSGVAGDDQIGFYTVSFPRGTSLREARAEVLAQEFPAGARWGEAKTDDPACYDQFVISDSVAKAFGADAAVLVAFYDGDGSNLNHRSVDQANVLVTEPGAFGQC